MENTGILQNQFLTAPHNDECAEAENCSEISDAQLITLILAGDETAFENLFEKYKRFVAIIASRYFRRPEQIEEVVQISFAKAYFELKDFRGENNFSLASWLGKITTNSCLDIIKRNKRKPENLLCEISEDEGNALFRNSDRSISVEHKLIEHDLAEKLLSQLPAADRAILQMLFSEEMSVAEVSQLTGQSKANVKVRAYRARIALRKIIRKFL